jgi:hypothetical protein
MQYDFSPTPPMFIPIHNNASLEYRLLRADGVAQRTAGESTASGSSAATASATTATAATSTTATTTLGLSLERVGSTLRTLLQNALVGLDKVLGLVAEGKGQALQTAELDTLAEDDG